jgi:hypothetical protein
VLAAAPGNPLGRECAAVFEELDTRESEKKLALFPGGHLPPKNDLVRESLIWLDRFLGTVRRVQ